jgi:hypothetical protein
VQPGFNGFVYRCGDVGEMSRHIMQVLDDQDLSARMCQASTCIGRQHQALAHGKALAQALTILESDGRR